MAVNSSCVWPALMPAHVQISGFKMSVHPSTANGNDASNLLRQAGQKQVDRRLGFQGLQPSLFAGLGGHELKRQWFDLDPRACFLVAANGHVIEMNAQAEVSLAEERFMSMRYGKLIVECDRSNAVLARLVAMACAGHAAYRRELLQGADLGWRPVEALGLTDQVFAFISYRCPITSDGQLSGGLAGVADAFGLTTMETKVLGQLVQGSAPKDIGRHLDICTATVRTHLRSVFAKCNVQGIGGVLRLVMPLL